MNKTLLLSRLQNERDHFELLLNRVGFSRRLTLRGVSGGLTVKDLLAEILTHEQFIADRLSEVLHGWNYSPSASFSALEAFQAQFGYPDFESPLYQKGGHDLSVLDAYKNIEFDEIVAEELALYSNILEFVKKLSHHQCLDHDLYHRVAEHTYRLYRRTGTMIERWLKQDTSELK